MEERFDTQYLLRFPLPTKTCVVVVVVVAVL